MFVSIVGSRGCCPTMEHGGERVAAPALLPKLLSPSKGKKSPADEERRGEGCSQSKGLRAVFHSHLAMQALMPASQHVPRMEGRRTLLDP